MYGGIPIATFDNLKYCSEALFLNTTRKVRIKKSVQNFRYFDTIPGSKNE